MASVDSDETMCSRESSLDDYRLSFLDNLKVTRHKTDRKRYLRLLSICTAVLAVSLFIIFLSQSARHAAQPNSLDATTDEPDNIKIDETFHVAPSISGLAPGDLLNSRRRVIANADRSYFLRLEKDGNLVLYQFLYTGYESNTTQEIWSLGTGNIERDTENILRLTEDGILYVIQVLKQSKRKRGDPEPKTEEHVLWHSNLIPECKSPSNDMVSLAPAQPLFSIGPNGELVIQRRCQLRNLPSKTAGKLAILVSGLYRSNYWVCGSHVHYLARNPDVDTADIFAYILYEQDDLKDEKTPDDIEASIRECYGHYLRKLTLKLVDDVAEEFPDKVDDNCGRMHRLQSQLKTLYMSGLDWWQWSVTNGVKHDTVLRVRTDHEFHGGDKPRFKPVSQMKGNELVLTPIAGGSPVPTVKHWFCSNPYGRMDVAISDQLAYGSRTAMRFFLMMYQDFRSVIAMSVPANKAFRGNWLCLSMPTGPESEDCENPEYCTIECALSWYLHSWGIEMSINWDWEFHIKR